MTRDNILGLVSIIWIILTLALFAIILAAAVSGGPGPRVTWFHAWCMGTAILFFVMIATEDESS